MVPYSLIPELHYFRSCPHSTTVRWGLHYKDVEHRLEHTSILARKKLRQLSGQTWPPVLIHKGKAYTHQQACTRYLESEFSEKPLTPKASDDYSEYFIVSHWVDRALHYVMVAIKYLNKQNFEVSKASILEDREPTLLNRLLVELAPMVQANHLFHQDYVASELPEIQRILSECWRALDTRLKHHDFIVGNSLTYVDMQVYANMKTMHGCVELEEVETLPQLREWKRRIETNYEWPHT